MICAEESDTGAAWYACAGAWEVLAVCSLKAYANGRGKCSLCVLTGGIYRYANGGKEENGQTGSVFTCYVHCTLRWVCVKMCACS